MALIAGWQPEIHDVRRRSFRFRAPERGKSARYRAILEVFAAERAHFTVALRSPEIAAALPLLIADLSKPVSRRGRGAEKWFVSPSLRCLRLSASVRNKNSLLPLP